MNHQIEDSMNGVLSLGLLILAFSSGACSGASSSANNTSGGGSNVASTSVGGAFPSADSTTGGRSSSSSASTSSSGASATSSSDRGTSSSSGGASATNSSGGATTTSSSPASDGGAKSDTIGRFSITLNEANVELSTDASTTANGKVYDGPVPTEYISTPIASDSNCTVYEISVPRCEGGCTDGVCVAENTCKANPAGKNVGEVTISGVATADGETSFKLSMNNNSYRTGGGLSLKYPGFDEGDPIKLTATGADFEAFEISTKGIPPLQVEANSFTLSKTNPVSLTWNPADQSTGSTIFVNVNLSHHGGSKGYIECNLADSGALTIPAQFIAKLIALGVAGFPTITITRQNIAFAQLELGRVVLAVTSPFVRTIALEGITSCEVDTDCTPPQTCLKSKKLCQ